MSSLLQFGGDIRSGKVGLEFCRWVCAPGKSVDEGYLDPKVPCTICGKEHPQIGMAWRRPCGMLGCWVQFRYFGGVHAPDLSVDISVPQWPRGTKLLTPEENSRHWHRC